MKTLADGKGQWFRRWESPSESTPGKNYTVSITHKGVWACSCWPYLRGRKANPDYHCKHIEHVLATVDPMVKVEIEILKLANPPERQNEDNTETGCNRKRVHLHQRHG